MIPIHKIEISGGGEIIFEKHNQFTKYQPQCLSLFHIKKKPKLKSQLDRTKERAIYSLPHKVFLKGVLKGQSYSFGY